MVGNGYSRNGKKIVDPLYVANFSQTRRPKYFIADVF
jgi:hypothetical protein